MTTKSYFENIFDDFTSTVSSQILNERKDGISHSFHQKLHNFTVENLNLLRTKLHEDVFYDGTVYTGSAGLAFYYFMLSMEKNNGDEEIMKTAAKYLQIDNLRKRRITYLCGDAGPLALATVISFKLKSKCPVNLPEYTILTSRLMDLILALHESPDELLYGKAGYLYALLFVNKYITNAIPSQHIKKVISAILKSGKIFSAQMKSKSPLLWQWHDKIYLGAAHGVAGILYLLLQAQSYINSEDMNTLIKPTLEWLMRLQFKSGNFPSSIGSSSGDTLVQWCHGAPGFVPLCVLAYQIFDEDKYLKIAFQCGEVIWKRGLCKKGYSLCHGVSGNAYSFIELYKMTKDPVHLYRACCFMEWCISERLGTELHKPDRPASLFEGLLGRLFLVHDIMHPLNAKFPAFSL